MHPYRRIPPWIFWPLTIIALGAWLILIAWLILKLLGVEVGNNPLESIPQMLKALTASS
jgi:hypothetical protein